MIHNNNIERFNFAQAQQLWGIVWGHQYDTNEWNIISLLYAPVDNHTLNEIYNYYPHCDKVVVYPLTMTYQEMIFQLSQEV
jgi:hypothetical protein